MNLVEALNLMKKYIKCPKCGCETVGAGTGTIDIDTEAGYFIRTCHCGWKVEIREEKADGYGYREPRRQIQILRSV